MCVSIAHEATFPSRFMNHLVHESRSPHSPAPPLPTPSLTHADIRAQRDGAPGLHTCTCTIAQNTSRACVSQEALAAPSDGLSLLREAQAAQVAPIWGVAGTCYLRGQGHCAKPALLEEPMTAG